MASSGEWRREAEFWQGQVERPEDGKVQKKNQGRKEDQHRGGMQYVIGSQGDCQ